MASEIDQNGFAARLAEGNAFVLGGTGAWSDSGRPVESTKA